MPCWAAWATKELVDVVMELVSKSWEAGSKLKAFALYTCFFGTVFCNWIDCELTHALRAWR